MVVDTFCYLPWTHVYVEPNGKCKPCCDSLETYTDWKGTFEDTLNTEKFTKLRHDLANGIKNPNCDICWRKENAGVQSLRQRLNNFNDYSDVNIDEITNDDYSLTNPKIKYLDIRSSNLCNYKCRFCGPRLSHTWVPIWRQATGKKGLEWPKNGIIEFDMTATDIANHIPYINSVNLAGGEPVIMPGTYWLIDEFIKQECFDVDWAIISNTSRLNYGNRNILDLLAKFKNVIWTMSIDAIGKQHSYLRSGVNDWDNVYANTQTLIEQRKLGKLDLAVHCSVSWLNLYGAYDVWKMYRKHVEKFYFNFVKYPEHFNIHVLPQEEIERAIAFYESKPQHEDLDEILSYLKNPHKINADLEEAKAFHVLQDSVRNEHFSEYFPEWIHLFS